MCGVDEECCQYIQCPIQCEGGINQFNELVDNDLLDGLEDDSNCPAALAKRYSINGTQNAEPGNGNLGVLFCG